MQTFDLNKQHLVYPYQQKAVSYWTKKWGIKTQQLHEAILETGSIQPRVLRAHLAKKGIIFTWPGLFKRFRKNIEVMVQKYNGTYYEEQF